MTTTIGNRRMTIQLIGSVSVAEKSSCVNSLSALLRHFMNETLPIRASIGTVITPHLEEASQFSYRFASCVSG
jgi:hypothetical protein